MTDKYDNLSKKIAKAKGESPDEAVGKEKAEGYSIGWRFASEMIAGLLVGFGLGFYIDDYFGTSPIFLLIFILLGVSAGLLGIYKLAMKEE